MARCRGSSAPVPCPLQPAPSHRTVWREGAPTRPALPTSPKSSGVADPKAATPLPLPNPLYEQAITPSRVDAAPAPTWTVHWVMPWVIVLLVTVAVYPLAAGATAEVLPDDSEKLLAA